MNKALQLRKGTSFEHLSFTGLEAEISVDTDKNTIIVHDGITAGGHELVTLQTVINNYAPIASTISGYGITDAYTKSETDVLLNSKVTQGTTLDEYGIADAYTRTAIQTLLDTKANADIASYRHNMLSGVEFTTGNFKNDQEIFGILLDGFTLPINTTGTFPITGYQSNFTYWISTAFADNTSSIIPVPYYHPVDGAVAAKIVGPNIEITTTSIALGAYSATFVLNYVKNDIILIPNLNISTNLLVTSPTLDLLNTTLTSTDLL